MTFHLWKMMLMCFQKVISKKIWRISWRSLPKTAGSGSGSISQRYGSADPDPHQNFMDPQHCFKRFGSHGEYIFERPIQIKQYFVNMRKQFFYIPVYIFKKFLCHSRRLSESSLVRVTERIFTIRTIKWFQRSKQKLLLDFLHKSQPKLVKAFGAH